MPRGPSLLRLFFAGSGYGDAHFLETFSGLRRVPIFLKRTL